MRSLINLDVAPRPRLLRVQRLARRPRLALPGERNSWGPYVVLVACGLAWVAVCLWGAL